MNRKVLLKHLEVITRELKDRDESEVMPYERFYNTFTDNFVRGRVEYEDGDGEYLELSEGDKVLMIRPSPENYDLLGLTGRVIGETDEEDEYEVAFGLDTTTIYSDEIELYDEDYHNSSIEVGDKVLVVENEECAIPLGSILEVISISTAEEVFARYGIPLEDTGMNNYLVYELEVFMGDVRYTQQLMPSSIVKVKG